MFKSMISALALIIVMVTMTACSKIWPPYSTSSAQPYPTSGTQEEHGVMARTVDSVGEEKKVAVTMQGGGEIGLKSMDSGDKLKMSRALDAAPGKSTTWVNGRTGIKYTVTPIKKVIIENNPFCRSYQATAEKGGYKKNMGGTACVMTDGSWHTV